MNGNNGSSRPGARELGLAPGILPVGPLNAITDDDKAKVVISFFLEDTCRPHYSDDVMGYSEASDIHYNEWEMQTAVICIKRRVGLKIHSVGNPLYFSRIATAF